jgi:hypothetical protein
MVSHPFFQLSERPMEARRDGRGADAENARGLFTVELEHDS